MLLLFCLDLDKIGSGVVSFALGAFLPRFEILSFLLSVKMRLFTNPAVFRNVCCDSGLTYSKVSDI